MSRISKISQAKIDHQSNNSTARGEHYWAVENSLHSRRSIDPHVMATQNETIQPQQVSQPQSEPTTAPDTPTAEAPKKKVKKKLTKTQKLAIARAMAEKRKKEERAREEREREAMSKADSESRAYEREVKYQIEEKERREWELQEAQRWEAQMEKNINDWRNRINEQIKWKKFLNAEKSVNPAREADLNTWIGLWQERQEKTLQEALEGCQDAEQLVKDIELMVLSLEAKDRTNSKKYKEYIETIRKEQSRKIDLISANIIQTADEYANQKNEVLLTHKTEHLRYGIWVNINKNPRIKRIEYPNIGISCDIPKNLALTSVALRVMHFNFDVIDTPSLLRPLGGVLFLELLALPPPPKKVKGWTIRQVTPLSYSVSYLKYPPSTGIGVEVAPINMQTFTSSSNLTTATGGSSWPALRVSCLLPPNIVIRDPHNLEIGAWDKENKCWSKEGISDVAYDIPTKTVVFNTFNVTALAILQHKYLDLPCSYWSIRPIAKNEAILSIRTAANKDVDIWIGEGLCRLVGAREGELRFLEETKMPPLMLLMNLAESGINLIVDEEAFNYLSKQLNKKEPSLERKLSKEMSRMIAGFAFSWSKWNNQQYNQNQFVFQVKEPDAEEWRTCLYQEQSCFLVKATESDSKFREDLIEGFKVSYHQAMLTRQLHQHLYHCLIQSAQQQTYAQKKVERSSPAFIETVHTMFNYLRLLACAK